MLCYVLHKYESVDFNANRKCSLMLHVCFSCCSTSLTPAVFSVSGSASPS